MADFDRDSLKQAIARVAERGVFIGTSSWKYPGWCGQLYDSARYPGKRIPFLKKRFEDECLAEYGEVFKTVCVDGAYYNFPGTSYLEKLASQVPKDFQFAFKVTDKITIKKFTKYDGPKLAGKMNELFLNADAFINAFLTPCEQIRSQVGILMFEFSTFHSDTYELGKDFVADLDTFFSKLPKGWPYGVELRNRYWLRPEYFDCLTRHGVAHVYNSWADMPAIEEQIALAGSETNPDLVASRFLLKPGRKYDPAVKLFHPYDKTKEVNEEARKAGALLIQKRKNSPKGKTLIFVNNRLEGNALNTIRAMLDLAESEVADLPGVDNSPA